MPRLWDSPGFPAGGKYQTGTKLESGHKELFSELADAGWAEHTDAMCTSRLKRGSWKPKRNEDDRGGTTPSLRLKPSLRSKIGGSPCIGPRPIPLTLSNQPQKIALRFTDKKQTGAHLVISLASTANSGGITTRPNEPLAACSQNLRERSHSR